MRLSKHGSIKVVSLVSVVFALVWIISGCEKSSSETARALPYNTFVLTTDYSAGGMATIDVPDGVSFSETNVPASLDERGGIIHKDAVARYRNGKVYVIARAGGDNITVMDKATHFTVERQFSTGPGTNPQDIAFVSDTEAWVTRYDSDSILVVNPQTGAQITTVSLVETMFTLSDTTLEDTDGYVEMAGIALSHSKIFVAVQRLDRSNFYSPVGESFIAVFDANTRLSITEIPLPFTNPTIGPMYDPTLGEYIVGCVGSYSAADGGVFILDTVNNTIGTMILTEASLSGDIQNLVISSASKAYVLFSDSSWNLNVAVFNPTNGTIGATVFSTTGFNISGLAIVKAKLLIGDRTATNPGVRIFNTADDTQLTTNPVDVGMPPASILAIE